MGVGTLRPHFGGALDVEGQKIPGEALFLETGKAPIPMVGNT